MGDVTILNPNRSVGSESNGEYSFQIVQQSLSCTSIEHLRETKLIMIAEIPQLGILKKPLAIYVTRIRENSSELYEISSPELDILETGESQEEALDEFYAFFVEDAKTLMTTDDNALHPSAKRLKDLYSEYIR